MRCVLAISLAILCLVNATPITDDYGDYDDEKIAIPEADKPLILMLAEKSGFMMVVLMMSPEKVILEVMQSILNTKKADQHILDDLQYHLNKLNRTKESYDRPEKTNSNSDYVEDIVKMFVLFKNPEYIEKRNRFNLWTDGQYDKIMRNYYQLVTDQQREFNEVVKKTVPKLSEYTRYTFRKAIEKLNNAVGENSTMDAASALYGKLSYYADIYSFMSNTTPKPT